MGAGSCPEGRQVRGHRAVWLPTHGASGRRTSSCWKSRRREGGDPSDTHSEPAQHSVRVPTLPLGRGHVLVAHDGTCWPSPRFALQGVACVSTFIASVSQFPCLSPWNGDGCQPGEALGDEWLVHPLALAAPLLTLLFVSCCVDGAEQGPRHQGSLPHTRGRSPSLTQPRAHLQSGSLGPTCVSSLPSSAPALASELGDGSHPGGPWGAQ